MDSEDQEALQDARSRHQPSSQERGSSCNPRDAHPLVEYEMLSDMLTRALEEVETLRGKDKKVAALVEEKMDLRDEMLQILNRSRIVIAEKEYLLASQQVKLTEAQKMTAILKRKLEYAEGNAEEIESANRLLKTDLAQIKSLREVEQVRNSNALRRAGQEEKDKAGDISHFQKEAFRLQNELSAAQDAMTSLEDRSAAEHASSEHRIAFLEESLRAEKALSEQQKSTDRQQLLAHVASSRATIAELENELGALKHSSKNTTAALQASFSKERVELQHEIAALKQESEKQRDSFQSSLATEKSSWQVRVVSLKQELDSKMTALQVGYEHEKSALERDFNLRNEASKQDLAALERTLSEENVKLQSQLKEGGSREASLLQANEALKQELQETKSLREQLQAEGDSLRDELESTAVAQRRAQQKVSACCIPGRALALAALPERMLGAGLPEVCEEEAVLEAELERVRSELESKTHSWQERQRSAERQEGEIQARLPLNPPPGRMTPDDIGGAYSATLVVLRATFQLKCADLA
ncbi:hypothetical protein CYMTET_28868 [Cymbomonas tetramitiformis]|uniref:Uncharacterized protein n=1 Tax=Cymbomonas tetramitiformis TaxID=36881 RepID=A0AAE0KVR2_9CHLO|nr:hypothetical protein CYMTET_28868 [Cymbomonas tetramitiformis]